MQQVIINILIVIASIYSVGILYAVYHAARINSSYSLNTLLKLNIFGKELEELTNKFINETGLDIAFINKRVNSFKISNRIPKGGLMYIYPYLGGLSISIRPIALFNSTSLYNIMHELIHSKQYSMVHGFKPLYNYSEKAIKKHNLALATNDPNRSLIEMEAYFLTYAFMVNNFSNMSKKLKKAVFNDIHRDITKSFLEMYSRDDMLSPEMESAYNILEWCITSDAALYLV